MRLRPYQVEAAHAVQEQFRRTRDVGAMLVMATGTGKTVTGLNMAQAALERGNRVLWLAHRRELITQPVRALCKGWPRWTSHAGIVQAERADDAKRFVCASVDTLTMPGRLDSYLANGVPALVVWDECFPAGTPIRMADGTDRPVEDIRTGDRVLAWDEAGGQLVQGQVGSLFMRPASQLVAVTLDDGRVLRCTPNHPVLTTTGWTRADALVAGTSVICAGGPNEAMQQVLRGATGEPVRTVLPAMQGGDPVGDHDQDEPGARLRQDDGQQPDGPPRRPSQDDRLPASSRASAPTTRWQRDGADGAAVHPPGCPGSGLVPGACGAHRDEPEDLGLAQPLQGGRGQRHAQDRAGDRRGQPREPRQAAGRSTEGRLPPVPGLAGPALHQQRRVVAVERCAGRGEVVYNFEVLDLHTYVANGVVVHNCHHSTAPGQRGLRELLSAAGPCWHLGLTATPEGPLAELWRLVYHFDIRDAQEAGYLLRERVVVERLPDLEESDYRTDEEEGEALLLAGVVDHTVRQMSRYARGRYSLVFTATIEQAQATTDALVAAGFRAAWVSGNTPKRQRADLLRRFQAGELDALVNAAVLTEGTDLPRANCVVIARSCASKVLWIQTVGRGLRLFGPGADGWRPGVDRVQEDCLVLDLAGASIQHEGLVIAPVLLGTAPSQARGAGDPNAPDDGVERDERSALAGLRSEREPVRAVWVELVDMDRDVRFVDLGSERGPNGKATDLGRVIVVRDPHTGLWSSYHAVGTSKKRLQLFASGVDFRTAQMLGNDLVRRASGMTTPFAPWRKKPVSSGLVRMANQLKVELPDACTSGQASTLISSKLARKQVIALGLARSLDLVDLALGEGIDDSRGAA